MALLLVMASVSQGAGLDLLEVGGAYGTPGATNPSALWYNPAGLAVGGGTQFLVEGAFAFGGTNNFRTTPDYGDPDPAYFAQGYPDSYDYSGTDRLALKGVVPFIGVSTNFLVPGLGVGAGVAIPTARGGASDQEWGANRYAIRAGDVRAANIMVGASYQILGKVALGLSGHLVDSSYFADTDTTAYPDLENAIVELLGPQASFQDAYIEDQAYATTAVLGGDLGNGKHGWLKDRAFSFGAGIYLTPIGKKLGISLGYNHGVRVDNEGPLTLKFQCPPQYDALGRFGAESRGICDTTMQGTSSVGYRLPGRIHFGAVVSPIDKVRIEAMGAYVFWNAFTDYEIKTNIAPSAVPGDIPDEVKQETADLVSQDRRWARDAQNTFWLGIDGKVKLNELLTAGGRLTYDRHAVPDPSVSANNADFDSVILGLMTEVNPIDNLGIGLSFSHHFLAARTITNSAFGVTIDDEAAKPDRYFYPETNGKYSGAINRLGLAVSGKFGGQPRW